MRKLLLLFVLALTAIGVKAADFPWTSKDGQYTVTASDVQVGNDDTYQKLVVSGPGALAAFVEANQDPNNLLMGVGGNDSRVNLQIEGELNSDDFSALNSSKVERWGTFTSLDLKNANISDMSVITSSSMSMSNLKYMRLPSNLTDVSAMQSLKDMNSSLDIVLSISDLNTTMPKAYLKSFTANSVPTVSQVFKNGNNGFEDLRACKYVTMSGDYGVRDLVDGTSLNFGEVAVWDFTGAGFEACNVDASVCDAGPYYASDNPFCEGSTVTLTNSYPSNAFYYFRNYSTKVVEIKLPTGITALPPSCMHRLGEENAANYKLVKGLTDAEFNELASQITVNGYNKNFLPIETLEIPDNIVTLGFECCRQSAIKNVVLGLGVKDVQGGAFKLGRVLESLDAKTGINNCRLGDQAFQECNNMKHVVLHEGIISLGAYCFDNSQELESIRLPETLVAIGNFCFKNGHALSSITIPENVEKIGKGAFQLTALTDVYLTTTDATMVPEIWTAGTAWGDWENASFSLNQLYGNNSCHVPSEAPNISWEKAVEWYYASANRIAVLHFPEELKDKVRSDISGTYAGRTEEGYGLPNQSDAWDKRSLGLGDATNVGYYSSDGWAQFVLMKEFVPNKPGGDVFTKEYDDVWYTMCFPFDLTDEQLATAFNEGFNIVDFSGVEVTDDEISGDKTLTLHFNKVAKTIYKDLDGNVYKVTGRAQDGNFEYNTYERNGQTYSHVQVGTGGDQYKTKTFALNGDKNNGILMIDGILASAGHPYMVHPNTGTNSGMPLTRCHFSGIEWKDEAQWESIYNREKREIDLGETKGDPETNTATDDNYMQKAYPEYDGNTYTFIGSWQPEQPAKPTAPTEVANPGTMTDPSLNPVAEPTYNFPEEPGDEPTMPTPPDVPTEVTQPTQIIEPWSEEVPVNPTTWNWWWIYQNGSYQPQWYNWMPVSEAEWNTQKETFTAAMAAWTEYNDYQTAYNANQQAWNAYNQYLQDLASYETLYDNYLTDKDNYDNNLYPAYLAKKQAYDEYMENVFNSPEEIAKRNEYASYLASLQTYQNYLKRLAQYNKYLQDLQDYQEALTAYNEIKDDASRYVRIPTNAYFLGRIGRGWPKFYLEASKDDTRKTGLWTQYTAIIMPNDAAVSGIEADIDGSNATSKGLNMVFDESFMGFYDPTEIKEIVAEAEEKGQEVEHVNIVVSINGQVVRRGSTSLEGLPTGLYIVNGKKYYVK